jgi:hypothetical protein
VICVYATSSSYLVLANVLSSIGNQSNVTGSLHRDGQPTLVLGAGACLAPALDLATICQEASQSWHVLVVDFLGLF